MVATASPPPTSVHTTGISLSPGGLLLPYHLGVLDALRYKGILTNNVPIAGSSAGAIATACAACQIDSKRVLDATVDISDQCAIAGGARGRLLPLLREKLNTMILEKEFYNLQQRESATIIAYKELFPKNRPVLQKEFTTRQDLFNAVCYSSMFPFFATNWPVALEYTRGSIPRLLVDGFFTVPRERFGCPDFSMADVPVDRTIHVCVFPREVSRINIVNDDNNNSDDQSNNNDCVICPEYENPNQVSKLFQLATESSSRKELTEVYESGWKDTERWYNNNNDQQLN